jgi:uncharacterized protein (TIGR02145 family)
LTLTSSGQVAFATNGFGKFIPAGSATYYDWSNSATRNNRWGNGSEYSNRTSDIAFSSWTFNGVVSVTNPDGADNNPCPGGWSVPSLWQWKDMHDGDGSSTTNDSAWRPANDAINDWGTFRFGRYGAVGGAVITNAAGEKVFLPAAGNRTTNVGSISGASSGGFYWSSTPGSRSGAHLLFFDSGKVGTFSTSNRAIGHSVRCVTEF